MDVREKGEGFRGQRIVVLPRAVVARSLKHPLLSRLLPTDIGYFPRAAGHLRRRETGVDQAILIYCVQGRGWCELGGVRHDIQPGELLVIPPGVPHTYGADPERPWTIPWVHVAGSDVPVYLREAGLSPTEPVVYLSEDHHLLSLFEEVLDIMEHGYAPAQLLYASQAVAHLLGLIQWRRQSQWRGTPGPEQKINQSIHHMKEHLDRPLYTSNLAAVINLSVSHYIALFKRQTGFAPMDYFVRLRMHRACQLLDTTSLTIKEIAASLGYDDQFHFSRVFKKVNDMSPAEHRRLHKA